MQYYIKGLCDWVSQRLIMDCVFTMATECKFVIGPISYDMEYNQQFKVVGNDRDRAPLPEIHSTGRLIPASHMDVDVCLT